MYDILDTKKTTELNLLRKGWFSAEYELTDNTYCYGKLCYNGLYRRTATAESATGSWTFKPDGLFNRTISIIDQNGILIGKSTSDWFIRRRLLSLHNGFQAEFYRSLFLPREYTWESVIDGKIMRIKSHPLNLKDTIYIDLAMVPPAIKLLLIFLGAHLTILNRRRSATH